MFLSIGFTLEHKPRCTTLLHVGLQARYTGATAVLIRDTRLYGTEPGTGTDTPPGSMGAKAHVEASPRRFTWQAPRLPCS